jgi:hypothetical protein
MSAKGNIVKAWVTSIIGTLLMLSSLFLWFFGLIPLLWEGVCGIVLGAMLLMAPRTIESKVSQFISAWSGNMANKPVAPPVPPAEPDDADKVS